MPVAVGRGPDGGGGRAADCPFGGPGAAAGCAVLVLVAELEDGLDLALEAVDVVVDEALVDEVLLPEDAGDGQDVADLPQVHCAVIVELQRY